MVKYKHIWRAFLLPSPDEVRLPKCTLFIIQFQQKMNFLFGLEKPVYSGSTSYYFLLIQIPTNWKQIIKIECSEKERKQLCQGQLKESYSATVYTTLSRFFKLLVGVNIIIPGNFETENGSKSIYSTVKASQGLLYPLSKSLVYITKPITYISLSQISQVRFHRINTRISRYFEIEILKSNGQKVSFMGIDSDHINVL